MSSLNFVCKPYQSSKVLSLVAESKAIREPNLKTVGILRITVHIVQDLRVLVLAPSILLANLSIKVDQIVRNEIYLYI